MPAVVICPSCNTTLKPKTPVPAGTRIKCPKCQTVFAVPDDEEVAAAPPPAPAAEETAGARVAADDLTAMGDAPPKPKKTGTPLWVWLVGGGAILLLGCCGVCGGLGYWGYQTAASAGSGSVTLLNYAQIQKGMSEAQVKAILGEPARRAEDKGETTVTWQDGQNKITVTFMGDKATERSCHLSTSGGIPIDQTGFGQ